MGTSPDALKAENLAAARQRLRRVAHREPWPLRLLEPAQRPLVDAFLLGLAAGGSSALRHWFAHRIAAALTIAPRSRR
ncbi:hypothetical protein [Acidihalobacter ferrooxydans]|uniref:Uncharacterized protein n=1 Tax=Acidihalobacter ferrooxydans TaxID=1765967 RepID=A0A1P8UF52_9GAMM|nr:hypothetical protein [Acidihalobacter ferrooxydans]APZ42480.1 hypothetical protein BW247_04745 [Acidihalobacter ferrooxydans]